MGVSYDYARRHVGQEVLLHCTGNRTYCGIIHRVTPHQIYFQRTRGITPVSGNEQMELITADQTGSMEQEINTVSRFGFGFGFPAFAVTTLALFSVLAISLFWW